MTTDHPTACQREASGCSWRAKAGGFGGSVDVEVIDPWNVPGRYGWMGGTGTPAHITPSTGAVTVLLSQLGLAGSAPALLRDFWRYVGPPVRDSPRGRRAAVSASSEAAGRSGSEAASW